MIHKYDRRFNFFMLLFLTISFLLIGAVAYLYQQKKSVEVSTYHLHTSNIQAEIYNLIKSKRHNTMAIALLISKDKDISNHIQTKNFLELRKKLSKIPHYIKKYTEFKNVWIQVVSKDGTSLYRSWSAKRGDNIINSRLDIQQVMKTPKITSMISTGKFDMTFKSIVPIFEKNSLVGIVEVITHFNSIAKTLENRGIFSAILVDKKYKKQLVNPLTKKFIEDYYVANLNLNSEVEALIKKYRVKNFIDINSYKVFGDYLVTLFRIDDINGEKMGYYLAFNPKARLYEINSFQHIVNLTLIVITVLLILLISIALLALIAIKKYLNFSEDTNEMLELEVQKKTQEIRQSVIYDKLTQCYKKAKLDEDLHLESSPILIVTNIDNFSYINSSFGFDVGDHILTVTAKRLKELTGRNIYRINADEFAFLSDNNYKETLDKIKSRFLNDPIQIQEIILRLTFSFGIATGKESPLRKASIALKDAKTSGKNRYSLYQGDGINAKKEFVEWNEYLYKALHDDPKIVILPFFQGICDNKTGEITKYETLARIKKNERIFSPFHFLEVAKVGGFTIDLTKLIIEKSFHFMKDKEVEFTINITETDLKEYYLLDFLSSKSAEHSIEPSRVTLEILEGVSTTGTKNSINQLLALKKLGFQLAIDDFGTEYSNFERLNAIEVDYIKIDGKYIKEIDKNEKSKKIVMSIIYFAKMIGAKTIAEFVHNKEVQKVVEEIGIDYSQGFYFSEPSPKLIE